MITETIKALSAVAQTMPMNVSNMASVTFFAQANPSVAGHACAFEYSLNSTDGTDGVWLALPAARITGTTSVETTSGTLAASSSYAWRANVTSIPWVRVRVTAHTSGSMVWYGFSSDAVAPESLIGVGGSLTATGPAAHDAVISGSPVRIGARAVTTNYTPVAAGDVADVATTLTGAQVVKLNAPYGAQWRYNGTLTTTADVALRAAQGAGIFNALTDLVLQNTNATATLINIKDGTTTIGTLSLPANMTAPILMHLITPLLSTANAALNIACATAGANVLVIASGFSGT